jgi:hypothetical protein
MYRRPLKFDNLLNLNIGGKNIQLLRNKTYAEILAEQYINRVLSDGGTIMSDFGTIVNIYQELIDNNEYDSLAFRWDYRGGFKFFTGTKLVSKTYDFSPNNYDFTSPSLDAGPLHTNDGLYCDYSYARTKRLEYLVIDLTHPSKRYIFKSHLKPERVQGYLIFFGTTNNKRFNLQTNYSTFRVQAVINTIDGTSRWALTPTNKPIITNQDYEIISDLNLSTNSFKLYVDKELQTNIVTTNCEMPSGGVVRLLTAGIEFEGIYGHVKFQQFNWGGPNESLIKNKAIQLADEYINLINKETNVLIGAGISNWSNPFQNYSEEKAREHIIIQYQKMLSDNQENNDYYIKTKFYWDYLCGIRFADQTNFKVQKIYDLSYNKFTLLQNTVANQPIINENGLYFDGINDSLIETLIPNLWANNAEFEIIPQQKDIRQGLISGVFNTPDIIYFDAVNKLGAGQSSFVGNSTVNPLANILDNLKIKVQKIDDANYKFFVNDIDLSGGNSNGWRVTPTYLAIGGGASSLAFKGFFKNIKIW